MSIISFFHIKFDCHVTKLNYFFFLKEYIISLAKTILLLISLPSETAHWRGETILFRRGLLFAIILAIIL